MGLGTPDGVSVSTYCCFLVHYTHLEELRGGGSSGSPPIIADLDKRNQGCNSRNSTPSIRLHVMRMWQQEGLASLLTAPTALLLQLNSHDL